MRSTPISSPGSSARSSTWVPRLEGATMTSVDGRSRHLGDTVALGPEWLHAELPAILRDTGELGARGADTLGLSTLGFDVDGTTAHLGVADGRLVVRDGVVDDGPVAALDASAFSD